MSYFSNENNKITFSQDTYTKFKNNIDEIFKDLSKFDNIEEFKFLINLEKEDELLCEYLFFLNYSKWIILNVSNFLDNKIIFDELIKIKIYRDKNNYKNILRIIFHFHLYLLLKIEENIDFITNSTNGKNFETKIKEINESYHLLIQILIFILKFYKENIVHINEIFLFANSIIIFIKKNKIVNDKYLKLKNIFMFTLLIEKYFNQLISIILNPQYKNKENIQLFFDYIIKFLQNNEIKSNFNSIILCNKGIIQSLLHKIFNNFDFNEDVEIYNKYKISLIDSMVNIYKFNTCHSNLFEILLNQNKESFINLVNYKTKKNNIIKDLYKYNFYIELLNKLFLKEKTKIDNKYAEPNILPPENSFIFNGVNSKITLKLNKFSLDNSILILSFQLTNDLDTISDKVYPLIIFETNSEDEIMFKLYIKKENNINKLFFYQKKKDKTPKIICFDKIQIFPDNNYYISIKLTEKKINIQIKTLEREKNILYEQEKDIIYFKNKSANMKIGHDDKNNEYFKGYIGSLMILKNFELQKNVNPEIIIKNILELKNHYNLFPYLINESINFDIDNYFYFYSAEAQNQLKKFFNYIQKNISHFDCTLYITPEILNTYNTLFWQSQGYSTLPEIPNISQYQNCYVIMNINVSLTKINHIYYEFQKNNGFYYFCLLYEYYYQLANDIISNKDELNIDLSKNNLEINIINSINSTLNILLNYVDYQIVFHHLKSFKNLFRNIYESLKKLKKISNNIIPKTIPSLFKLIFEFKSAPIAQQKHISNNFKEKIVLPFSNGLIDIIYDTELYEDDKTNDYINMLFVLSRSFVMNYLSNTKENELPFKPDFFFKILNFTKILENSFTNDYKNKPKIIDSFFIFLKFFFKTIIDDNNGILYFKKLLPFSLINYENNLTISYNFLKFIHELLWEKYWLEKEDIELLMNYQNNLKKKYHESNNILIIQINSVISAILVKLSFPNLYDDIRSYLILKLEELINNNIVLSNIIYELRRIFEKIIKVGIDEFKNILKKNKANDIDYMEIFWPIFIFIIDIFKFLINKCEEVTQETEDENEMEISNRERSFNELFSLLDRVTELLKTELKSKGSNSYRVYCLINFIKFYHYIIFNEPEIFEISEKAFTDNLIRVIDLSSQYCILNCNQLFKIKIGNLEQNKTVIEIIFELYIQYILNCKESLESFKNLLLNFNSFFYDNKFRSDKQYSIFYSNNYLRYLLSQKKIKEKSETVLAKYNTILNYNKNIFISEEKFEINFNTYFLKLIIDAQKKFQNNNDLNKQLVNNLMSFINTLFSTVLQEHTILYSIDKNYFFKASSSTYYNEQISYIRDKYIKKNIPYDDAKSYLESIYDKMNLNKKDDNNDNQNEALEKKASNNDIKEKEEICYADNYKKSAPFVFNEETYQIQFFNNLDKNYISNFKKDLMNGIFALYYIDEFFHNDDFCIMKKYYNNFINKRSINDSKKLNYPSILKNYRNNLEPSIFIKQYNNYFDDSFLTITHKYVNEDEQLKKFLTKKKSIKLSQKNFCYSESNKEIECELLKNESTFYGKLIYNESENYFLFKEEFKDFTKEEKDPYKYLFLMTYYWQSYNKKRPKSKLFQRKIHNKNVLILFDDIEELVEMRILLLWKGIEIYAKNGKSYLFNFLNTTEYEKFLKEFLLKSKIKHLIRRKYFISEKSNLYKEWIKGLISNHEYILLLNRYGSRSFNDPEQYPIFPWILNNCKFLEYFNENENIFLKALKENLRIREESEEIFLNKKNVNKSKRQKYLEIKPLVLEGKYDQVETIFEDKQLLNNDQLYDIIKDIIKNLKKILRDFMYPISLQTDEKRQIALYKYEEDEIEENSKFPIHCGCHYSNSAYVYFYLMRQQPFDNLLVRLQEYNLEDTNRCLVSISSLQMIVNTGSDNRELIPEFFSKIEYFMNLNYDFYGYLYLKNYNLDDCEVDIFNTKTHSLSNYVKFIIQHKKTLNSKVIGYFLNQWIDIIFGINQLPSDKEKRKKSCNIFSKSTYEQKLNLEKKLVNNLKKERTKEQILDKIKLNISQLINFGMAPAQIFRNPHEVLIISTKNEILNNSKNSNNKELNKDLSEDEEDEGDFEAFINKNIRLENLECSIVSVPIYFYINPTINKIFVYNSKDNLIIYDCQLFNELNSKYFHLSEYGTIDNPNISYLADIYNNSIYQIKYGFSAFDHEINYNNNDFNKSNVFHTYYFNKINYWLYKDNIAESNNNIEQFKFITCRHIDFSFKIHYLIIQKNKKEKIHIEKVYSFLSEDFVSACCCISSNSFILGLKNGKLISYKLQIINHNIPEKKNIKLKSNDQDEKLIIIRDKYIQGHHGKINTIDIDKKLGIIITSGDDNYIFIRKIYDFELLLPIKIKKKYKILMTKISSFNFLYILCFNNIKKNKIIFGYTLSGIRFAKSEYGSYDNISFTDDGDIFTLVNKENIIFLSGSDLKKLNKLKNKNTIETLNKIKKSKWMQLNCFLRNDDDNISRIITYLCEEKNENYIKTINLESF